MNYYDLMPTTEIGAVCLPCREYKSMVDCTECGAAFCIYCADECPACGEAITYSQV